MNYIRSLFLNFLVVFFVDRVIPGIEISSFEQVPNIGADILFAAIVGFLNASIFPFHAIMEIPFSKSRLALFSGIISFGGFIVVAMVPFGISVNSFSGAFVGGCIVWVTSYFCNYLEWRHDQGKG